jgi:two-component system, LytTR family, response regulator
MRTSAEPHRIKTLIVDDEKSSREALSIYLNEYCPVIDIVGDCDSVKKAFKAIHELNPDLVFLDIEMPMANGFELLKMFNPVNFRVIFVTAYSEYALDAFRYSAVDYLLKPVKVTELIEAVKKTDIYFEKSGNSTNLNKKNENIEILKTIHRNLVVCTNKGFSVINPDEIIICKAEGYCTCIYLEGKNTISSSRNLKYIEGLLPYCNFMRVHHSYLINLNHVKGYSHQEEILLTDNNKAPLSNVHKNSFLNIFKNIKSKPKLKPKEI